MKKAVYLAARYSRRQELCQYREDLLFAGFPEFAYEVTTRWLNTANELIRDNLAVPELSRAAREDWEDVISSDIVISFTEQPRSSSGKGGRHVEFGAAMALGKRCIVVGPRENVFHCLPGVEVYATWQECLAAF